MARQANRKQPLQEGKKIPDYLSIGEMLRDTRASYNISLEQAAAALHIRPPFLSAIEAGKLEEVAGGAVYAKGYLRMYAQYLGIDLATMLSLLSTEAAVKPVASHSSSHHEPKRIRLAAFLSLLLMLAGAAWYGLSAGMQETHVKLIKPLPNELTAYLAGGGEDGLDSPCIRQAAAAAYPPCYAGHRDEALLREALGGGLGSVMRVPAEAF